MHHPTYFQKVHNVNYDFYLPEYDAYVEIKPPRDGIEKEIKKAFYRDEADAEAIASTRAHRISGITDEASPEDFVD